MNVRALTGQTRKLADIAKFAYGESVHVAIDTDCDFHGHTYSRQPEVGYRVYVANPVGETVSYKTQDWKNVLALITWLEDVEATTTFRSR
jgi:hypothetical protein